MKEPKSLLRMLKFALFSASAGLIQVAVFTALNEGLKWSYWAAYLPALVLSVVWNFTFNRKYTFRSANFITEYLFQRCVVYKGKIDTAK